MKLQILNKDYQGRELNCTEEKIKMHHLRLVESGTFRRMDTTSNGHNAETWTQRRNELLDTSPKLDISAKFLIGHNPENGHSAEIGKWTYRRKWTQRRKTKTDAAWIENRASQKQINTGWTLKLDITPKYLIGRNVENGHNVEIRN
ncbi:hypothetical protein FQR65_LT06183 [Abscondita terminalis]|nr:hypothetical protein FQR65_LT06183 [Abscondita terminalis]